MLTAPVRNIKVSLFRIANFWLQRYEEFSKEMHNNWKVTFTSLLFLEKRPMAECDWHFYLAPKHPGFPRIAFIYRHSAFDQPLRTLACKRILQNRLSLQVFFVILLRDRHGVASMHSASRGGDLSALWCGSRSALVRYMFGSTPDK